MTHRPPFLLLCAIALCCIFSLTYCSAESTSTATPTAIQVASELQLWNNRQWRALLHCRGTTVKNEKCDSAASEGLFSGNSTDDSPKAELTYAIEELSGTTDSSQKYQCHFPARSAWLRHTLSQHGVSIPAHSCKEFDEWYAAIQPHSATVVFPTSFMNNPASAFGHTFIRFDRSNSKSKEKLTSYTANFSASTGDDGALLYAYKGVFGGYFGFFTVSPYYDKVKLYSDLEDRDIWEYDLALTPAEVDLIVRHLWELRRVPFSYYYFDDNCSYQLLSLLEVARPGDRLSSNLPLWVTPVDTVRLLVNTPELVSGVAFRPSLATTLKHRAAFATEEQIAWATSLIRTPGVLTTNEDFNSLPSEEQALRLELGYDLLTYAKMRDQIEEDQFAQLSWELLSARSRIGKPSPFSVVPTPEHRPDLGHGTIKGSVGFGLDDGVSFGRATFRPSFHDHQDPLDGYLQGAQIKFLDTAVRVQSEEGLVFERVDLLDVESLASREQFYAPISWSIRTGINRGMFNNIDSPLVYSLQGGPGVTYSLPGNGLLYTLLEAEVQSSHQLDQDWAAGGGPKVGMHYTLFDSWRITSDLQGIRYFAGDLGTTLGARITQDFSLSTTLSFRVTASHATTRKAEETLLLTEIVLYGSPVL